MTTELDKSNIAYTYWMKGKEEGKEEGREEGRVEGRVEGREEGYVEGVKRERKATVRSMLELGMDVEIIMRVTGMDREEIMSLDK